MEARNEHRAAGINIQYPVSCLMRHDGREFVAEVLNYHFRGACLKLAHVSSSQQIDLLSGRFKLDFLLGRLCLQSDIPYRVCWEDLQNSQTFGVEFTTRQQPMVERADRFLVNTRFPLTVETADPLDPHRLLLLQVIDVSERGMLLQTSLSNRHIFPGMRLSQSKVIIPGQLSITLDLNVENARQGSELGSFLLGVGIHTEHVAFKKSISDYLSQLAAATAAESSIDEHLNRLSEAGLLSTKFKAAMTYRIISTEAEYEDVLKLRFTGYGRRNKVKLGTTWRDQGEGLANEGPIVGSHAQPT